VFGVELRMKVVALALPASSAALATVASARVRISLMVGPLGFGDASVVQTTQS
jgi:hypothetical protein